MLSKPFVEKKNVVSILPNRMQCYKGCFAAEVFPLPSPAELKMLLLPICITLAPCLFSDLDSIYN